MTAAQLEGPAIRVQGPEQLYKELDVLRGVDFDVARGTIFALLGSNGAGKTTIVKILSTLLKVGSGLPASTVSTSPCTPRRCGVDQPHRTVRGRRRGAQRTGNLVLVAKLRHLDDPGAVADDLLARFSLTEAAARKASTYSGGILVTVQRGLLSVCALGDDQDVVGQRDQAEGRVSIEQTGALRKCDPGRVCCHQNVGPKSDSVRGRASSRYCATPSRDARRSPSGVSDTVNTPRGTRCVAPGSHRGG